MLGESEFVKHALKMFQLLNWKPARPDTLAQPHLVVFGAVNENGIGPYCAIDDEAKVFKIQINLSSLDQKLFTKVTVRYRNDMEAIEQFEHYMDAIGGFVKDAWIRR